MTSAELCERVKDCPGRIIFLVKFGSHLYGTNGPNSDLDIKGVAIPSANDILSQSAFKSYHCDTKKYSNSKNTKDDVDIEIFSVHEFFKLALEGQTVALDMLFANKENYILASDEWTNIVNNTQSFLHSGVSSFASYCKHQANKYGIKGSRVATMKAAVELLSEFPPHDKVGSIEEAIKRFVSATNDIKLANLVDIEHLGKTHRYLEVCGRKMEFTVDIKAAYDICKKIYEEYGERARQAETNQGVDWKALSHAVRVASEANELLDTGKITFPRPDAQLLKDIKFGKLEYRVVSDIIENGLSKLEALKLISLLPLTPDRSSIDNLLLFIYRDEILRSLKE